jgi:DNA-binding transcriptional ArsR family regulator
MKELEEKLDQIRTSRDAINSVTEINLKIINDSINEIVFRLKMEAEKIESLGGEVDSLGFQPSFILDLPDHLRLTAQSLLVTGEGSAEDISRQTGRSRSLESSYLNTLTTMGYVGKNRKGQVVYYKMKSDKI